jgi:hypothetical protein
LVASAVWRAIITRGPSIRPSEPLREQGAPPLRLSSRTWRSRPSPSAACRTACDAEGT